MSNFFSFLRRQFTPTTQRERDEAWLAASANLHELEHRMRELELRTRRASQGPQGMWFERSV